METRWHETPSREQINPETDSNQPIIHERVVRESDDSSPKANYLRYGSSGCLSLFLAGSIIFALVGVGVGSTCTARIPLTETNSTIYLAVGHENVHDALKPDFLENARPEDMITAQGFDLHLGYLKLEERFALGVQPGSPTGRVVTEIKTLSEAVAEQNNQNP